MRLEIDNWRWAGVPFYIRTGKRLPVTQTELRVIFREPPPVHLGLSSGDDQRPVRDEFVVKLDPSTGARLVVDAHRADGQGPQAVTLDVEFADEGGEGPTPYEVLLHAALVGDSGRFKRQDVVEECWRVMQPLIDNPSPVQPYAPDTWGPAIASTLVADHGGWQGPWIVEPAG
jgi:glucose-6-phosphate 1-dehydrogenase